MDPLLLTYGPSRVTVSAGYASLADCETMAENYRRTAELEARRSERYASSAVIAAITAGIGGYLIGRKVSK